jgi:hypothetical protein
LADPFVTEPKTLFTGKVGSTQVKAGQAVYFDGTDWELADADDNTKYAEGIAVNTYESGAAGVFARGGIIVDTDAPYTLGDQHYLSTTAGAITATRPTGAVNLCQVIGEAFSTSEIYFDIPPVRELVVDIQYPYVGHAAPQDNDNDFYGVGFDDTSAVAAGGFMVPQNVVGLAVAYTWWAGTGVALDTSDTYTFDASAGVDDETTSATPDGILAAALTVAANDLARGTVTTGLDGSGIIEPGNYVGIAVQKAAEGSGGDDPIMLGTHVVLLAV